MFTPVQNIYADCKEGPVRRGSMGRLLGGENMLPSHGGDIPLDLGWEQGLSSINHHGRLTNDLISY